MIDLRQPASDHGRLRRLVPALPLAVVLGACGAGDSGGGSAPGDPARTGGPSSSASQLADADTTTLAEAQAIAAGAAPDGGSDPEAAPGEPSEPSPEPDRGAAAPVVVNPLAVLPETASAVTTPAATGNAEPGAGGETGGNVGQTPDRAEGTSGGDARPADPAPTETPDTASPGDAGGDSGPTESPEPAENPEPTEDPEPTEGSEPAGNPDPVDAPEPTEGAEPTENAGSAGGPTTGASPEPDESPEPVDEPVPAETPDSTASGAGEPSEREFKSPRTPGFAGEVRDDGTVRVSWNVDPNARGYNVYRDSEFVASVFGAEYVDENVFDRDYYYEVQSFDHSEPSRLEYIAKGLTVRVRGLGRTDPDAPRPDENLLDGYDLVFADEFDTGALDPTKWNTSYLWGPDIIINSEEQYYVDILREPDFGYDPFTFENGSLVINSVPTPDALRGKAKGQPYLSGVITSYDAFKFTYGYAEARARVPYGKGYWPAFWLLNAYYVDDEPEIDIMEFIGDNEDTVYHTYHYYDENGELRSTRSEPTRGADFTADFHTYAVDWRPGLLVYYVDGIEVHRVSDPKVSRQDMYLIANTAIGGWWPGSPDGTTPFPGRYEIDYIRVYRQTAPYGQGPQSDGISSVAPASQVPGASPAHRPPFHLWPEGYPGRP